MTMARISRNLDMYHDNCEVKPPDKGIMSVNP